MPPAVPPPTPRRRTAGDRPGVAALTALTAAALLLPACAARPRPAGRPGPAPEPPTYLDTPANPALQPVADDPRRPRVLLIGDSISIGYTTPVRSRLAGRANVHRIPENGGPTTRGLARLETWLGTNRWEVVHFNFGLHDLKRDEHGRRQVEPDDYRRNLAEIVARLRRTGAALVWATTTPVPAGVQGPRRDPADVARYNQVARGVMEAAGVRIHDLGGFAQARAQRLQIPRNVHFTPAGSAALARPVAREIRRALRHRNHQKRGSRHPPGGRPGGVGRAGSRPANASAGECGAAGAAGNPAG